METRTPGGAPPPEDTPRRQRLVRLAGNSPASGPIPHQQYQPDNSTDGRNSDRKICGFRGKKGWHGKRNHFHQVGG